MDNELLPQRFRDWFASRGWSPHPHQLDAIAAYNRGESTLVMAPTGGGKTLTGFLPSLIELSTAPSPTLPLEGEGGKRSERVGANAESSLHTLYLSPLKALAADIERNLARAIEEMQLPIRVAARTGDTSQSERAVQRKSPPHILLTTPESLALMVSYTDAGDLFKNLRLVIVDELHAIVPSKRGDQTSLLLTRLEALAPGHRRIGLSATIAEPEYYRNWLGLPGAPAGLIATTGGEPPEVELLRVEAEIPWTGYLPVYAVPAIYARIAGAKSSIIFVNTRSQAELMFQMLWEINERNLPIALHHGSLTREARQRVEAAMAAGEVACVVATASLDLGIDWADVDLVVQVGAPKGVARLLQRVGRAGHRLDVPSRALLVPANRFELIECQAAIDAVEAGQLDGPQHLPGGLDVAVQHILACACSQPIDPPTLHAEMRRAYPYRDMDVATFNRLLQFARNGGYTLSHYDRFEKLTLGEDGRYHVASPRVARQLRMNVGTIVEAVMLKVRVSGSRKSSSPPPASGGRSGGGRNGYVLGEVEESFGLGLVPGDTFVFGGELLQFTGLRDIYIDSIRASGGEPKVPAYAGGRLPLTTFLADGVLSILHDPARWGELPNAARDWLELQRRRSILPEPGRLLVETFPRGNRWFMVAYPYAGRNAHQTLGMLVTRRMERMRLKPLGFVATDYAISVWSVDEVPGEAVPALFDIDMLGDDLESWLVETPMLKRAFGRVAVISGLIERRHPGLAKTGRQVMFSTDLIYDVLLKHEPAHILMQMTREEAFREMVGSYRLAEMLGRIQGRIDHRALQRPSPLSIPVLLDIGAQPIHGEGRDYLLREELRSMQAVDLIGEVMEREVSEAELGSGKGRW